jgi:hypothetical protein
MEDLSDLMGSFTCVVSHKSKKVLKGQTEILAIKVTVRNWISFKMELSRQANTVIFGQFWQNILMQYLTKMFEIEVFDAVISQQKSKIKNKQKVMEKWLFIILPKSKTSNIKMSKFKL